MLFAQAGVRVLAVDFDGGAAERMAAESHTGEARTVKLASIAPGSASTFMTCSALINGELTAG
jgi:hypothetical protein